MSAAASSSSSSAQPGTPTFSPSRLAETLKHNAQTMGKKAETQINAVHSAIKAGLYGAVGIILVFFVVSNSLTRLFKNIWSDVGNNWEYAWGWLLSWDIEPFTFYIVGSFVPHLVLFWTHTLVLAWFDTHPTAAISKFKIQPGKNEPIERSELMKAVKTSLFNQFFVTLPLMIATYPFIVWRGMSMTLPLPTFSAFLWDVVGCLIVEEFMFYYTHRLFHSKALYGLIHKKHHQFTAPVGLAAVYAHPLEHFASNLLPIFSGPFLMGSHVATLWVWENIAMMTAINTHSGYHFPLLPSPEAHDFHHLRFNQNYGVLGILDFLHGTDTVFRASKQFYRHRTYFSIDGYVRDFLITAQEMAGAEKDATTKVLSGEGTFEYDGGDGEDDVKLVTKRNVAKRLTMSEGKINQ